MKITADLLRSKGACAPDIEKFEKEWPNGCRITKKNCIRAFCELEMNPLWAATRLLPSKSAQRKFFRLKKKAFKDDAVGADEFIHLRALAFYEAAKMEEKE